MKGLIGKVYGIVELLMQVRGLYFRAKREKAFDLVKENIEEFFEEVRALAEDKIAEIEGELDEAKVDNGNEEEND